MCTITCVHSIVTDNIFSVKDMNTQLQNDSDFNLSECICIFCPFVKFAHRRFSNIPSIKEQIFFIVNFFRSNHFANGKYREARGNKLLVTREVWPFSDSFTKFHIEKNGPFTKFHCVKSVLLQISNVWKRPFHKRKKKDYIGYYKGVI